MPKVSIIIPCLNSAGYIRETMESVVNQTLREIEIIAVDAGSTDGTPGILQEYAQKDNRVKMLRSDKKSMGYQYNLGIDAAKSEYIGFLESDDCIDLNMYETLHSCIKTHDADYVKSDFDMFADLQVERLFLRCSPLPEQRTDLYGRVIAPKDYPKLLFRDVFIWNAIYSKNFIAKNNIRFNETPGAAFQDAGFILQSLVSAEKIIYIDRSFYRYRKDNTDSSFMNKNSFKFIMDEFVFIRRFLSRIASEKVDLFEPLLYRRLYGLFCYNLKMNYLMNEAYNEKLSESVSKFRELIKEGYERLGTVKRSWSDLWPPQTLDLFIDNFEAFCSMLRRNGINETDTCMEFARFLSRQSNVVLFGANETGGSVYLYLRRNGLKNIIGFCDNDEKLWNTAYVNRNVFAPEEIAEKHPDAFYVVCVGGIYAAYDIKNQLLNYGVNIENICNYNNVINIHTAFVTPTIH